MAMMTTLGSSVRTRLLLPQVDSPAWKAVASDACRLFSSRRGGRKAFRTRRRPSLEYRPIKPGAIQRKDYQKVVSVGGALKNPKDRLEADLGPLSASVVHQLRREKELAEDGEDFLEEELRVADYVTAEPGSTEELAFERRAFEMETDEERERFFADIESKIREGEKYTLDFESDIMRTFKKGPAAEKEEFGDMFGGEEDMEMDEDDDPDSRFDMNQLAHGEWSELLIDVKRSIKLWRGGRLESYRALMIGGNHNGCAGFGIGKAKDPIKAVDLAGRNTKRNIYFVDRYQGDGITRDLSGKMNSTKVVIRATDNGLRGNELCTEILKRFGITNAVAKAHGNRHPWNVVRATFKALMTHESLEEIALKRGKRIVSIDRAMRMRV